MRLPRRVSPSSRWRLPAALACVLVLGLSSRAAEPPGPYRPGAPLPPDTERMEATWEERVELRTMTDVVDAYARVGETDPCREAEARACVAGIFDPRIRLDGDGRDTYDAEEEKGKGLLG